MNCRNTVSSKEYLVCSDRSNVLPWCLYNVQQQTTSLMKIPEIMDRTKENQGDVRDMSSFTFYCTQSIPVPFTLPHISNTHIHPSIAPPRLPASIS